MPSTVPVKVIESIPAELAIPKSATVTSSRSFSSRFAGFTSRCTIPCRWAASSAAAACSSHPSARPGGCAPSRRRRSSSEPPDEMLHHDERPPFPVAHVEDRDRAGLAREARSCERLPLEAFADPFIRGVVVGEHLDRNLATEQLVGGEVDVAHRAAAEPPGRAVARRQQFGLDSHPASGFPAVRTRKPSDPGQSSRKSLQRALLSGCPAVASGLDLPRPRPI